MNGELQIRTGAFLPSSYAIGFAHWLGVVCSVSAAAQPRGNNSNVVGMVNRTKPLTMLWRKKTQHTLPRELVPIDTSDRGPAVFFHGRKTELSAFEAACKNARLYTTSTSFLVQGPPGVGKTALLHECKKRAETGNSPWRVVDIASRMLHDPAALAEKLDIPYAIRQSEHQDTTTDIRVSAGIGASMKQSHGLRSESQGAALESVLKEAAGEEGLILTLDEAQFLEEDIAAGSTQRAISRQFLKRIHNGEVGVPVMLLAAGLGTSQHIFEGFGITRFSKRTVHRLSTLDGDSVRLALFDWLVKCGGAPEDHEHLGHWIDTLAERSFGWPQHIQFYAEFAAQWLLDNGHDLPPQVPAAVLAEGRKEREAYYRERTSRLNSDDAAILADLLELKGKDAHLTKKEICSAFLVDRASEQADEMFYSLLWKGVIAESPNKKYRVPIPSMHDWLVSNFASAG